MTYIKNIIYLVLSAIFLLASISANANIINITVNNQSLYPIKVTFHGHNTYVNCNTSSVNVGSKQTLTVPFDSKVEKSWCQKKIAAIASNQGGANCSGWTLFSTNGTLYVGDQSGSPYLWCSHQNKPPVA